MSAVQNVKNCVSTTDASTNPFRYSSENLQRDDEGRRVNGCGRGRISFEDQRWEEDDWDPESLMRRELNARPLTPPSSTSPLLPRPLARTSTFVSAFRAIGDGIMAVVNGIASILTGLVNAVVEFCRVIVRCLTCGKVRH